MSLRYTGTGEATMDEPALRDVERWKDKIEVRLDNRQVFFLFFGSAMVACMLFVLGVIVGKRLESRGKAEAPPFEDPLAVLDRFGAMAAPAPQASALTFPRALLGAGASKTKPVVPAAIATAAAAASSGLTQTGAPKPTTTVKAPPATSTSAPTGTGAATGEGTGIAARRVTSTARAAPVPVAGVPSAAPTSAMASKRLAALPRPLTSAALPARPVAALASAKEPTQPPKSTVAGIKPGLSPAAGGAQDKPKSRFLLQLSSFQDRAEADAFARRFAAQSAYVVATEIPGKGTWYRVRVGSYGSLQEASAAKTNFERDHNVIAYVAGPSPAR